MPSSKNNTSNSQNSPKIAFIDKGVKPSKPINVSKAFKAAPPMGYFVPTNTRGEQPKSPPSPLPAISQTSTTKTKSPAATTAKNTTTKKNKMVTTRSGRVVTTKFSPRNVNSS